VEDVLGAVNGSCLADALLMCAVYFRPVSFVNWLIGVKVVVFLYNIERSVGVYDGSLLPAVRQLLLNQVDEAQAN
jgi:hypothetical protein